MDNLINLPNQLDAKTCQCKAIIETPKGFRNKFDYDPDSNLFMLGGPARRRRGRRSPASPPAPEPRGAGAWGPQLDRGAEPGRLLAGTAGHRDRDSARAPAAPPCGRPGAHRTAGADEPCRHARARGARAIQRRIAVLATQTPAAGARQPDHVSGLPRHAAKRPSEGGHSCAVADVSC